MTKSKRFLIVGAICLLILLVFPYARVEFLTWKHWAEFASLYKQSNMIDDIEYFKVMDYSKTSARVYYVTKNRTGADLFAYSKKDGQWVLEEWTTIWSRAGSADGFIWPNYR